MLVAWGLCEINCGMAKVKVVLTEYN